MKGFELVCLCFSRHSFISGNDVDLLLKVVFVRQLLHLHPSGTRTPPYSCVLKLHFFVRPHKDFGKSLCFGLRDILPAMSIKHEHDFPKLFKYFILGRNVFLSLYDV